MYKPNLGNCTNPNYKNELKELDKFYKNPKYHGLTFYLSCEAYYTQRDDIIFCNENCPYYKKDKPNK